MNAPYRSAARAGLVVCSVLAVALTGCRTHDVHKRTRTVYVPTPPPIVHVPPAPAPLPVVYAPPAEQPPVVVIQSEDDFYEPLAAYGRWEVVGGYGRCWIPARVEAGWRPYANGYWQRTDAGWYWASEEPWGWATYHYGRWDFHAAHGWIWVPQTQWAPAWVAWREGGGYVGWAPLRPAVSLNVSIGTTVREPAFESRAFVFVEHRRMLEPIRPKTVIVNNTKIINQTVNITKVSVVNKTVINEGPRPEVIERASGHKVPAVPVHEFRRRQEATIAARGRNIPTASERTVQAPARTESQPAPKHVLPPPDDHEVGRPVVIQKSSVAATPPARPAATPVRPTPPQVGAGSPARAGNKTENEIVKKPAPITPMAVPTAQPEVKSPRAVTPQRTVHPVEKSVVAVKPTARHGTTNPIRDEKKPEVEILRKITATPHIVAPTAQPGVTPAGAVLPQRELRLAEKLMEVATPTTPTSAPSAVKLQTRNEVRSATRPETKPPAKVESAPPVAARIQPAPPSERPADKRLNAPREKSRAAEQAEANKQKEKANNPKKTSEDQETTTVVPTRPAQ